MPKLSDLGKLMIIAPHLSDAVFACAEVIAGSSDAVLVSLFAGMPPSDTPLTERDAAAGFQSTQEAVAAHHAENRCALEVLAATAVYVDFPDSRYAQLPSAIGVAEAITDLLLRQQPASVMIPAGLSRKDHMLTHQACLLARNLAPQQHWFIYEDTLYRRLPSLLQQRLIGLIHFGIEATPVAFDTRSHAERKRLAVRCYEDRLRQLRAPPVDNLNNVNDVRDVDETADLFAPEGYWRLTTAALSC